MFSLSDIKYMFKALQTLTLSSILMKVLGSQQWKPFVFVKGRWDP